MQGESSKYKENVTDQSVRAEDTEKNIVAIFHASFHPIKGNVIDWSLKSYENLNLEGVEFSVLPSGLHLVEQDTVYFSHGPHSGIALFRRRPTRSHGQRGFRLSSFGILLQESPRPRPWLHLGSLRALADAIYSKADSREDDVDLLNLNSDQPSGSTPRTQSIVSEGDLIEDDFLRAKEWFESRKADIPTLYQTWNGWSDELDGKYSSPNTPTLHLPHLLRILGLSSLTLYKFVLSRRRILIFTLPPVEVSGILAWIAADFCREHQTASRGRTIGTPMNSLFTSAEENEDNNILSEPVRVLGMITLNDIQRLEAESSKGKGWIACTTDAIFLERPQYYDLVIDLTTSTPNKASRPTLYMSRPLPIQSNDKRKAGWKLETVRFTWSDVKLWTELDRILKLDSAHVAGHVHLPHRTLDSQAGSNVYRWTDAFQLYEDVCLLCATLWMGLGTWRSNSRASFASASTQGGKGKASEWGSVRLDGDSDWSMNGTHMRTLGQSKGRRKSPNEQDGAKMRNLGQGIEGRPSSGLGKSVIVSTPPKNVRKPSASSPTKFGESPVREQEGDRLCAEEHEELHRQNIQTTLALLQTFHANTVFWLSKLHEIIPPPSSVSSPLPEASGTASQPDEDDAGDDTIVITSREMLSLELGVLSPLDAKFVEWLAEAEGYVGEKTGRKIAVKKGWQELLAIVFGFR